MTTCCVLGGEEVAPEAHVFGDPDPFISSSFPDDVPGPVHSTPAPPAVPSLTEEQCRRMELNRQRAVEKKLARQQQQQQQAGERKNQICRHF